MFSIVDNIIKTSSYVADKYYSVILIGEGESNVCRTIETKVSLKRLSKFFLLKEFPPIKRMSKPNDSYSIVIDNATFSLDNKEILQNISLKVKRGQFIAIVGKVGSGKSTLLSAILGELNKTCGSIEVCGNISYVPQTPWLFDSTLRENILFGSSFDQDRFQRVIQCCALDQEIAALPLKDLTEIGERV